MTFSTIYIYSCGTTVISKTWQSVFICHSSVCNISGHSHGLEWQKVLVKHEYNLFGDCIHFPNQSSDQNYAWYYIWFQLANPYFWAACIKGIFISHLVMAGFYTQKNKHRIGLDFSILYYLHRQTKKVENTSTLYHPGCGSQVQTGTENWHRNWFNSVPIRSDPMLIFLRENRPLEYKNTGQPSSCRPVTE